MKLAELVQKLEGLLREYGDVEVRTVEREDDYDTLSPIAQVEYEEEKGFHVFADGGEEPYEAAFINLCLGKYDEDFKAEGSLLRSGVIR
jgi:hypothetical protein